MSTTAKPGSIESIDDWFRAARPFPTRAGFTVQLGVHCEEVAEMLDEVSGHQQTQYLIQQARDAMHQLANHLKTSETFVRVVNAHDFLDSLCDQVVTLTGVAYEQNSYLEAALAEVDNSNWSKFVDGKPIFNAHGKIAKGPNYFKADLTRFVGNNPNG